MLSCVYSPQSFAAQAKQNNSVCSTIKCRRATVLLLLTAIRHIDPSRSLHPALHEQSLHRRRRRIVHPGEGLALVRRRDARVLALNT